MAPFRRPALAFALVLLTLAGCSGSGASDASSSDDENRDAEFEQWLTEPDTHEALAWLSNPNHLIFEGDKQEVVALVERFRAAGSPTVWIVGAASLEDEQGGSVEIAAAILVRTPPPGPAREQVFAIHDEWAKAAGWDPAKDSGQKYLHLAFD